MPTYVLDGTSTVSLPRRPLLVTLAASGAGHARSRLTARRRDGSPAPIVQNSADMLILPRVEQEITIVAVPDGGRPQFDPGTVLHLSIGPDGDTEYSGTIVQVAPRDVSGLGFIELATVAPGPGDVVSVATRLTLPDAPLPRLAAQARVMTRGVLRVDRLPESQTWAVRCVVDTSTSMARHVTGGAVAAGGDIVAGIASVVSGGDDVELEFVGRRSDRRRVPGAQVGATLAAAPADGFGIGADPGAALRGGSDRGLTIVITDDSGAVTALAGARSAGAVAMLVFADVAPRRAGFVGAVCSPPDTWAAPGTDGRTALAEQPDLLRRIVADLLTPLTGGGGR